MITMATDRFQGLCLQQLDGAGARFMNYYDAMPPKIREIVRNSPINLCTACIEREAATRAFLQRRKDTPNEAEYLYVINLMEKQVIG